VLGSFGGLSWERLRLLCLGFSGRSVLAHGLENGVCLGGVPPWSSPLEQGTVAVGLVQSCIACSWQFTQVAAPQSARRPVVCLRSAP